MRILFVTQYAYLPQLYGGLQSTTDQLCHHLMKRGHQVAILAGFKPKGLLALTCKIQKKLLGRKASRDTHCGYPAWRAWEPWQQMATVAAYERPDLVVAMSGACVPAAREARRLNLPVMLHFHDVFFDTLEGGPHELLPITSVACSHFTAEKYREAYGLESQVIYPFIDDNKRPTHTNRKNVTFINPSDGKGLPIALRLAEACPDIPFTFVETWHDPDHRRALEKTIAPLPNVTLTNRQSDMRKIYGAARILLAPSLCDEAFGMVVAEAQAAGIPALATNRGGLPEAVGKGGVILDADASPDLWAEILRRLWHDKAFHKSLSAAARDHAQRAELNPLRQTEQWEAVFQSVLS